MISDEERREAARRLREHSGAHLFTGEDVERLIGIELSGFRPKDADNSYNRLADLIEPSEPKVKCIAEIKIDGERLEQLVNDAVVEVTGIDRDALLALADEFDAQGDYIARDIEDSDGDFDRHAIDEMEERYGYARRIREALGVER